MPSFEDFSFDSSTGKNRIHVRKCLPDCPPRAVIQIEQERMDAEMAWLETALPRYEAIKSGLIPPERCGQCAFCRETNKLTGPVMLSEFEEMGATTNE